MDLLDFACSIEQESIDFYSKMSSQEIASDLSGILLFLVEEEKRHYEIMASWRNNTDAPKIKNSNVILMEPAKVFKQLSDHFQKDGILATHYYNLYEKAWNFEGKSVRFYSSIIRRFTDGKIDLLKKIVDQETNHAVFFRNMLEFLRHPGEWLENAEWYHLDAY